MPASHFVFQSFEPVEGISPSEAEEAAMLSFEEELPFAPEQVAIGLFSEEGGRVAVWGCEQGVLPEAGSDEFLFPEFFPLLGWVRTRGAVECFEGEEGSCLLFFDEGGTIPTELIGLRNTAGDPEFAGEIESTFRFLGRSPPDLESMTRLSLKRVAADSRGRFEAVVSSTDGEERTWTLSGEPLWGADLRPSEEIKRFRSEKQSAERIWIGAQVAAGLLILAALGQFMLWGVGAWVNAKEDRQNTQAPLVRAVEERADLAARLKDLGESRISVFERLGDLNLARPDGIQFLDVQFDEPDLFRVEGRVANVRILNEYVDRLRTNTRFEVTDSPPPRTRDGRVEFELSIRAPNHGGQAG